MSSKSFLVNISDRPILNQTLKAVDGVRNAPGLGKVPVIKTSNGSTRFLGREDDVENATGPWVYHMDRPAGDYIPLHKHSSNRIEYLIRGEIEWFEPGEPPRRYGAGTMSYVEAGTVYGYKVLADAEILLIFEDKPGINML